MPPGFKDALTSRVDGLPPAAKPWPTECPGAPQLHQRMRTRMQWDASAQRRFARRRRALAVRSRTTDRSRAASQRSIRTRCWPHRRLLLCLRHESRAPGHLAPWGLPPGAARPSAQQTSSVRGFNLGQHSATVRYTPARSRRHRRRWRWVPAGRPCSRWAGDAAGRWFRRPWGAGPASELGTGRILIPSGRWQVFAVSASKVGTTSSVPTFGNAIVKTCTGALT